MSYVNRRYFENKEADSQGIWEYLSCIEKIAYHQFQDSPLIMEEVFCDDVNICLIETENDLRLKRNCIKSLDQYFDIKWKRKLENPIEYMKGMIDRGTIVGINTYFYDIPNFTWFKRERYKEAVHVCMVVGYDASGFWLTDVPALMQVEYLNESHFTTISYDDMSKYLAKQCNILTFHENTSTFLINEKLDDLINKIIQEYLEPAYTLNGEKVWKGRGAYERLLYLIRKEDPRLLEMDFYHGEYVSFIISGRHDILKRNILKRYGNNSKTEDVLQWLEICQKKWETLAYSILRENIKKGIYIPVEEDISHIYESEKMLMECLGRLVNPKGV